MPARWRPTRRPSTTSASSTPARARSRSRSSTRPGVPQVSPANTYVGLTTNEPGSAPGEPQKYYPTGKRTYLRIVPRDTIQAAAGLITMKQDGCTKVAVANDKEAYGAGLAALLELQKAKYGVNITSATRASTRRAELPLLRLDDQGPGRGLLLLRRHRVQRRGADHQGRQRRDSEREDLRRRRRLHELVHRTASQHGVPASIDPQIQCTVATQDLPTYPGGKDFLAAYRRPSTASANPDPYAIYGYEVDEARARHDRGPRRQGQRQGRRARRRCSRSRPASRCSGPTGSTPTATRR